MKTKITTLLFVLCLFFATTSIADDPPAIPKVEDIPPWLGPPNGLNPPGIGIDRIDHIIDYAKPRP